MSKKIKAWDRLTIARMVERPNAEDYIKLIFNNFFELHGDRNDRDDKSIIGGIGLLENIPVTIVGIQKGKNLKENMERNFGSPYPEGYRKALRLMKQAERFNRPIICFINTSGAYCGVEAEERGQGEAIARNLLEISQLTVPIISIIVGEGGSGGAIALACGDRVWALENSIYSILSPEGFASILLKDSSKAQEVSEIMGITSYDLLEKGIKFDNKINEKEISFLKEWTDHNRNFAITKNQKKLIYMIDKALEDKIGRASCRERV